MHMPNTQPEEKRIQVMELFGPTIQGEGIVSGTLSHFLRTGGCGLRCTWCDSLFAVLPKEILKHRTLMTTWEIIDALIALPWAPYVTFTGGDPAIQERLGDIIPALNDNGMRVAVETQGMYFPTWFDNTDVLTFSPKGPSSGNVVDPKKLADYCVSLGKKRKQRVCIKVVVFDEHDFNYAMKVYELIPEVYYDAFYFTAGTPIVDPDKPQQYLVNDEGKDCALTRVFGILTNQEALADMLLKASMIYRFDHKVHLGCQQHVLLWPTEDKGV